MCWLGLTWFDPACQPSAQGFAFPLHRGYLLENMCLTGETLVLKG